MVEIKIEKIQGWLAYFALKNKFKNFHMYNILVLNIKNTLYYLPSIFLNLPNKGI
jgi:hypothetical protein